MYLFHLVGIHVLSELFFPLFPLISSRVHIDPKISVLLVRGTSETLFFEIRPYFTFSPIVRDSKVYEKKSFTCFFYKWCIEFSFGSWGIKLYLFHLFGIHVLSEFSFTLIPLLSSRMHIDSEISLSLVWGTSETLFFEISPYFIIFHFSGF